MLLDRLANDLKSAIKANEKEKTTFLRFLLARLHDFQIEKGKENALSDEDVLEELNRELKRHQESIDAYKNAQREDLEEKERRELAVIESYLPEKLSEEEILAIIDKAIAESGADFGKVMSQVMAEAKGRVDGTKVAQLVRDKLK